MSNIHLNKEQLEAVTYGLGPLLIIAGAGTGKTTVITERIKYLILKKGVLPSQILALTFTQKASEEMEERVDVAMPYGYAQMWISTFHAFCDRILRNEAIHIGLNPSYKLMTEAETILFLRENIFKFNLSYFRPLGNPSKFLQGIIQHFSRLRDEDISPEEYLKYAENLTKDTKFSRISRNISDSSEEQQMDAKKTLELANAYKTYQTLKEREGVMDFADLITNTLKLFRVRRNILRQYQEQFKYILVDEFQDTNFAQNQLAILLGDVQKNITVVGDDDQAIYRWRGAAISNIIQFRKQFPNAKVVTLTKNYRSTQEILDKAYALIQDNNPDRLEVKEKVDKKLKAQSNTKSYPIELLYQRRAEDEADTVVKKIQELVDKESQEYKDIAILVRANDHSLSFVRALQRHNIPYQFLGPGRLFHQEEIKDLIAYLKVLYNFEDSASLYRVLTFPIFDLDSRDVAAILNFAKRKNLYLFEALEEIAENHSRHSGDQAKPETPESPSLKVTVLKPIVLKDSTTDKIKTLVEMIKRHLKRVPKDSAGQILYYFLEDSGMLKKFLSATATETHKYQNVAKFFDKLKTFEVEHEDARVFPAVDWIDLSMQMGESPLAADIDWSENNAVNILTIHSSKGLEFPVVFLVNLVSQRFPTRERREQIPIPQDLIKEILPEGDYHLQEERRLFYVGMTRAQDRLYFTAANFYGEGKRDRKLSPFVYEALGVENIKKLLDKQEEKKTIIQPSLLDWAKQINADANMKPLSAKPYVLNPITYISYSQIQTFNFCPLHYKLQYILKVPTSPSAALSFGSSLHAALRDFYQQASQNAALKNGEIIKILEKSWIDEGYASRAHLDEAFEKAKYVLLRYLKNNMTRENIKLVKVEIPFNFFLKKPKNPFTNLKVAGRIDRIDRIANNKIEIIDYKTGSNVPNQKEVDNNLQLTLYALGAIENKDNIIFSKKPEDILLSLYYLEEEKKLTTTRTKEQLEDAKTKILEIVEEIEKSDFTCSGSTFCQNCEYKMLCSTS